MVIVEGDILARFYCSLCRSQVLGGSVKNGQCTGSGGKGEKEARRRRWPEIGDAAETTVMLVLSVRAAARGSTPVNEVNLDTGKSRGSDRDRGKGKARPRANEE